MNELEACMGPGGIFGNIKGSARYLTMSNVVASRNIDVLTIEGANFYTLLKVSSINSLFLLELPVTNNKKHQ